jgi:hypothetical protein
MRLSKARDHRPRSAPMTHTTPIVFVVDDDIAGSVGPLRGLAAGDLCIRAGIPVAPTSPRPELPGAGRHSSGPQWSRFAEAHRWRSGLRRCANDGQGDESGNGRVLDEPIQRRRAVERDSTRHRAQPNCTCSRGGDTVALRLLRVTQPPRTGGHDFVVTGLLNKQVGFELGISEMTVKAHRGKVMRKMKADSLAALVTMAAKLRFAPSA